MMPHNFFLSAINYIFALPRLIINVKNQEQLPGEVSRKTGLPYVTEVM
jgi:hypothetical protein